MPPEQEVAGVTKITCDSGAEGLTTVSLKAVDNTVTQLRLCGLSAMFHSRDHQARTLHPLQ